MDDEFRDAIVFRGRPLQNAKFALIGLGFLALFVYGLQRGSVITQIMSVVGLPIFGWLTVRAVDNVLRGNKVTLAIGERGLFDWRLGRAWIPWADVKTIDFITSNKRPRSGLRVNVTPEFVARFPEKLLSRMQRWSNSLSGLDGYTIAFGGLDADPDRIARAVDRHYPGWRQLPGGEQRS